MSESNSVKTISLSIPLDVLGFITFIVFLILKVTGNWDISWFWVFFPLWLPIAIGFVLFVFIITLAFIVSRC